VHGVDASSYVKRAILTPPNEEIAVMDLRKDTIKSEGISWISRL
jgi:hypothetical protein